MSESAPSIQMMRQADRERLAKMVNEQPPVTREIWDQQIRLFEASGRDTKSRQSFFSRFWKPSK